MTKKLLYSLLIFLLITGTSLGIILYSRGYRLNPKEKSITTTGILSASSYPDGASIWLNGKLVSATNTSINLSPDWYKVKISKEGYQAWEKNIKVQGEIVSRADALLLPTNPSLKAITNSGVFKPVLSPLETKIAYIVPEDNSTPSANIKSRAGIWVMELKNPPFGVKNEAKQIYVSPPLLDWNNCELTWSPNEKQLLAIFRKTQGKKSIIVSALLFELNGGNSIPTEIITNLDEFQKSWDLLKTERGQDLLKSLPEGLSSFLSQKTTLIRFSPDDSKILYFATASSTLKLMITPPVIGTNSTMEKRDISKGNYYIYDLKEDKNYHLENIDSSITSSIHWYYDSKHIVSIENNSIYIMDYDGTNKRTVYSGPFENNLAAPWVSGGQLVILTNFHQPDTLPNLYELDLR